MADRGADALVLVQADHGLHQRIVISIADRPIEGLIPSSQVLGEPDRGVLTGLNRSTAVHRHPERVGDQRRRRAGVDGPANDPPGVRVEDDRAVHLALPGWVLGDVGDPQLVRRLPPEGAVDQVAGDAVWLDPLPLWPSGHALDAGAAHQQLDRAVPDDELLAEGEFGVHPPGAVGAAGCRVNRADQVGEPHVPNGPSRRRAGLPGVVARLGDGEHAGGDLHR